MWWVRKGVVDLCLPMSPSGAALLCCFRDPGSPRKTAVPVVTGIVITSFCPGSHFFLFQFHVSFALFQRSRFYPHNTPVPSKPPPFFSISVCFRCFRFFGTADAQQVQPISRGEEGWRSCCSVFPLRPYFYRLCFAENVWCLCYVRRMWFSMQSPWKCELVLELFFRTTITRGTKQTDLFFP